MLKKKRMKSFPQENWTWCPKRETQRDGLIYLQVCKVGRHHLQRKEERVEMSDLFEGKTSTNECRRRKIIICPRAAVYKLPLIR
ncbi:hypothetical protein HNY73_011004 [Argiope bruennichi]|uniref:Uncharacterized protein n=1 Tax=Argiope bruennichi TaxID=94029 RepID=A0A8T0F2V6_ARGBR|nr:hypothetical protein HNY73_011004 [Argiope bruennichi]